MDTLELKKIVDYFNSFNYKKPLVPLATVATTATKTESSINTDEIVGTEVSPLVVTVATNPIDSYLSYLCSWFLTHSGELPDIPPFPDAPERAIAWSAWWNAVEKNRRRD